MGGTFGLGVREMSEEPAKWTSGAFQVEGHCTQRLWDKSLFKEH